MRDTNGVCSVMNEESVARVRELIDVPEVTRSACGQARLGPKS